MLKNNSARALVIFLTSAMMIACQNDLTQTNFGSSEHHPQTNGELNAPTDLKGAEASTRAAETCRDPARMVIGIDATKSGDSTAFGGINKALAGTLPELALTYCINELEILEFADNGRIPTQKTQISLPIFAPPADEPTASETDIFVGVQRAQEDQRQKEKQDVWAKHRTDVLQLLKDITAETLMPVITRQPRCSDIAGFFGYLSDLRSEQKQIILIISDGHENCREALPQITIPANMAMSVFVLPLSEAEIKSTAELDSNFEKRKMALQERIPQANVVAYNNSVKLAVKESVSKLNFTHFENRQRK
ncbi:MAG TPA: hypothetical protein VF571_15860 [Pyrinomonadaceae bacterium]